ncbi:hypothetical protein HYV31_02300 [candidate division WWE3 bacterium]|nr:hypothetical protein [candidate division WWE3 bacterium]
MLENYFKNSVFNNFFKIELNPVELSIAKESITSKYTQGLKASLLYGVLIIPTLLFVDTTVLGSVLIPITMVSGTAWFAVSLVNIKRKFEPFGNELTIDLYRAFTTSLMFLALMALISLNSQIFGRVTAWGINYPLVSYVAGLIGTLLVFKMIYDVFLGATKYDMNDSMLTGQSEAAQQFFTKSLDFSHQVTDLIRRDENIQTTNYYISDGFSRIFNTIMMIQQQRGVSFTKAQNLNEQILTVLKHPDMPQEEVEKIFFSSLLGFKDLLNKNNNSAKKIGYVDIEIECLKSNTAESSRIKALRYATVFTLMYEIVTDEGQDIFV